MCYRKVSSSSSSSSVINFSDSHISCNRVSELFLCLVLSKDDEGDEWNHQETGTKTKSDPSEELCKVPLLGYGWVISKDSLIISNAIRNDHVVTSVSSSYISVRVINISLLTISLLLMDTIGWMLEVVFRKVYCAGSGLWTRMMVGTSPQIKRLAMPQMARRMENPLKHLAVGSKNSFNSSCTLCISL